MLLLFLYSLSFSRGCQVKGDPAVQSSATFPDVFILSGYCTLFNCAVCLHANFVKEEFLLTQISVKRFAEMKSPDNMFFFCVKHFLIMVLTGSMMW